MSPRPKKKRRCQGGFRKNVFKPAGIPLHDLSTIEIYRDELETLRLCDGEGLIQEQAGERMNISRGTVQRTLNSARKKVAEALTTGKALVFVDQEDLSSG